MNDINSIVHVDVTFASKSKIAHWVQVCFAVKPDTSLATRLVSSKVYSPCYAVGYINEQINK